MSFDSRHPSDARWELRSPDGRLLVTVFLDGSGRASFEVAYDGRVLFDNSPLGISTSIACFGAGLTFEGERRRVIDESYELVSGKASAASNHAHELVLSLARGARTVDITFRAADDGVAFRYELAGTGPVSIIGEDSAWRLAGDTPWRSWCQALVRNYEGFYPSRQGLPVGHLNFPALLRKPGHAWALLSEAAVFGDACGSHLLHDSHVPGVLHVVPADDQTVPVRSSRPAVTPWRVAIIGAELRHVVESLFVENLSPSRELDDVSWVRPGRVYWSWWAGDPQPELATHVAYVDTAAELGFEYYLADAGWQESWLPALVKAATARGVGILVWFHHRELLTEEARESRLGALGALGVRGVKVDFFDSDSQERIALYDELARSTAAHRLLLNYHGATKPAGERRRWPHLLTREGVLGAEYYKFDFGPTAEHNCTLPFTRNVIGPMDYTPLSISNCSRQTTVAHQLALPVVFESGLQHLSDPPATLLRYGAGRALLAACPTAWDETRLVDGYPGEHVVVARRRGTSWFVGALSASDEEHAVTVPLDFLGNARHEVAIYGDDGQDGIAEERRIVDADGAVDLRLQPWGGAAAHITPT